MTCFLPVASTAARKSALSHALTSPLRLMKGAVGCIAMTSAGRGPLGPTGDKNGSAGASKQEDGGSAGSGVGGKEVAALSTYLSLRSW